MRCRHLSACLLLVLAVATPSCSNGAVSTWTGANSFILYALNATDRLAILDAMHKASMTVLRISISQVEAGTKGSSALHVNDVEHPNVGDFDDTILGLIDQLMSEAKSRGIRLIIAMHDRYALGCNNKTDAYTRKYALPVVDDCSLLNAQNLSKFYTDGFQDFKNRINHIMNYKSPSMGNYPWKYLSEAVFSFEPQHEAFGHVHVNYNLNWLCNMCAFIKSILGTTPIYVSTGGGTNFSTSLSTEKFTCPEIDIISIHSYDTSASNAQATLSNAVRQAKSEGKRIVLEEFGAKSSDKTQILSSIASAANEVGVPWLFWEVMMPGQGSKLELEVSPSEDAWTNALAPASLTAGTKNAGAFEWSFSTQSAASPTPAATPHSQGVSTTAIVVGVISGSAGLLALFFLVYAIYRKVYAASPASAGCLHEDEQQESILDAIPGLPTRFTYKELQSITNGFADTLGKGGFGTVYAGILPSTGTKLAVKQLEGVRQGDKEFRSEVAIMAGIHHYNLLRLIGFCAEGVHRLLVYEHMENGSLDRWLFCDPVTRIKAPSLSWDRRGKIAAGAARGLAYLHDHCRERILHLDIKPQNILLDHNFVAKVADFGLSRLVGRDQESRVMTTMRGTPGYLAPEWVQEGKVDQKCDVYSFGMLLMEITSGRRNVDHTVESEEQIYYPEWAFGQLAQAEGHLTELTNAPLESEEDRMQLKRMINTAFLCISQNPASRPSMETVVQMLEGNVPVPDIHSLHQSFRSVLRSGSTSSALTPISGASSDSNWSYSKVSAR